jgi:hypothetical protein
MANPRKRRSSEDQGESGSSLDSLPIFRPNYQYSICHPILVPANDDEMIAIMTYPATGRLSLSSFWPDRGEEATQT